MSDNYYMLPPRRRKRSRKTVKTWLRSPDAPKPQRQETAQDPPSPLTQRSPTISREKHKDISSWSFEVARSADPNRPIPRDSRVNRLNERKFEVDPSCKYIQHRCYRLRVVLIHVRHSTSARKPSAAQRYQLQVSVRLPNTWSPNATTIRVWRYWEPNA